MRARSAKRQLTRAARRPVARASSSPWIPQRDVCAARPPRRPARRACWGEIEKLCCARTAIHRIRARARARLHRTFFRLDALVGCPQEPEWHPKADVWVHTLLVIDEARKRIDDWSSAAGRRDARRRLPRSRQARDDGVRGWPNPIARARRTGRPAGQKFSRPAQRAFAPGLRRAARDPRHRREPLEAGDVLQGAAAGGRRRVPPPRAESRSRAARARRESRLRRTRRRVRASSTWR